MSKREIQRNQGCHALTCIYGTCHACMWVSTTGMGKQATSEALKDERSRAEAALEAQADLQRQLTDLKGQLNLLKDSLVLYPWGFVVSGFAGNV